MRASGPKLGFEELVPGASWRGRSRTVTETDVVNFAGLTGDYFPLHTNEEYARETVFGTRIGHGLLGLSLAHGLMWARTGELDDTAIAFLGMKEWQFLAPLKIGDTIHVQYEVVSRERSTSRPDRGTVEFLVQVFGADQTLIQRGYKKMLIKSLEDN